MKYTIALYSLIAFLYLSFAACENEPNSGEADVMKQDTVKQSTQVSDENDDSPLIDNVAVEFKDNTFRSGVQLNGKDVKYYNVNVQTNEKYSVKLTGTDPYTNLLIFSPEGEVLYNQNTGDSTIVWEGGFRNPGKATFHVSLESGHAEKDKQTVIQFTLNRID